MAPQRGPRDAARGRGGDGGTAARAACGTGGGSAMERGGMTAHDGVEEVRIRGVHRISYASAAVALSKSAR